MELVFNELSLLKPPADKAIGIKNFESFLKAYTYSIKKFNYSRCVVTCHDLNDIMIADGYHSNKWRNQDNTDRDLQTLYKRMCELQHIQNPSNDELEITFDGTEGRGMLIAYIDERIMLSLPAEKKFETFKICGRCYSLETDETNDVYLYNISTTKCIDENFDEISSYANRYFTQCNSCKDLLNNVSVMFPNLVFSDVALNQIETKLEKQHLEAVINKLKKLDDYFSKWDGKEFDMSCFPNRSVSPESVETLKRYNTEHTFTFDNKTIVVSLHIRYTGNIPGRIYFYPDSESQKGIICSLTKKLPTVSNSKSKI